jgi:hypothetical protein
MKDGKQLVPVDLELTDEEEKAIEHVAESSGMKPDEFVRSITRKAAAEYKASRVK